MQQPKNRAQRFTSHALVEVRRFKNLPLLCQSAVLLDISVAGFKLEYTSEHKAVPGRHYWLVIPLQPLGLMAPSSLKLKIECRWFDPKRYRMGGVFLSINKTEHLIIEQVIESLKDKGIKALA